MCDYSQDVHLKDVCTRRAKVGDELELVQLGWGLRAFVQRPDEGPSRMGITCIRPGTEVEFDRRFMIPTSRSNVTADNGEVFNVADIVPSRLATFKSVPRSFTGSDGVEWASGLAMGLNCLPVGLRIRVLQLPAKTRRTKAKARRKVVPRRSSAKPLEPAR